MTSKEANFDTIKYEEAEVSEKKNNGHGAVNMATDFLRNINIKSVLGLFGLFLLITSDIFTDKILGNISGATDGRQITFKGAIIQALFLCGAFIMLNLIIESGLI